MSDAAAPTAPRPARRWVFVSDVHLGTVGGRRDTGPALAQFLEGLATRRDPASRVVLLGDVLEMLESSGRDEAAALERLDAIVAANTAVFSALRRCIRCGIVVEVVAGNHDLDLVRPAVGERLRWHLRVTPTDDRVRTWPWLYVVPGVLYAEHGNQHHDLNRVPRVLDPYSRRRPGEMHTPPLATVHASARGRAFNSTRRRLAFLAAVLTTWYGERAATEPAYQAKLRSYALFDRPPRRARRAPRAPPSASPDPHRLALGKRAHPAAVRAGRRSARRLSRRRRRRRARDLHTLGGALSGVRVRSHACRRRPWPR